MSQTSIVVHTIFVCLLLVKLAAAQNCDSATVTEVVFTDLTSTDLTYTGALTLAGDATITSGTALTTSQPSSFGGFFFDSPTAFQGTGGFSVKFGLQATDISSGVSDVWEFIIAGAANRQILSPPFTFNEPNNGLAGWSRLNALVVEFDTSNSGAEEQDASADHIDVFLAGSKICSASLAFSLASSDVYTVWIDFDGFGTTLDVRVSLANDDTRPTGPYVSCNIDIWSVLDIASPYHVGFAGYNSASGGAVHEVVNVISFKDAYRPYDNLDCGSYARCAFRTGGGTCVDPNLNNENQCLISTCGDGLVWDLAGSFCCAFIEKGTTIMTTAAGPGPFTVGQLVPCEQSRRVMGYLVPNSNCS